MTSCAGFQGTAIGWRRLKRMGVCAAFGGEKPMGLCCKPPTPVSPLPGQQSFHETAGALGSWVPMQVHDTGLWVNSQLPPAARVMTIDPVVVLEGGRDVYPEYTTGRFVFHIGEFMRAADRREGSGLRNRRRSWWWRAGRRAVRGPREPLHGQRRRAPHRRGRSRSSSPTRRRITESSPSQLPATARRPILPASCSSVRPALR